jgi:transglutaminase-like putative cysteine protease
MPLFHIRHRTQYIYQGKVIDSANQLKLYPIQDEFQKILEHRIQVLPSPPIHTIKDYFGNVTGFFSMLAPHDHLVIDNFVAVETMKRAKATALLGALAWDSYYSEEVQTRFHDFLKPENASSKIAVQEVIHELMDKKLHPIETINRFVTYIFENFQYKKGVTNIETDVDELWQLKAGVCQDFAHLLLYMLRLLGIPSRYISGYICPGTNEWRGEGATHAWAEAWFPDLGWIGLDPTNNCLAEERHVRLAYGRNFSDCTPVKGTYRGPLDHQLEVTVQFGKEAYEAVEFSVLPTFTSNMNAGETISRNSYSAYIQMQQQ